MLSETRQRIVEEALLWQGTPFAHMQRCKGAGVDCVQIVGGVGIAIGSLTEDQVKVIPFYSLQFHLHRGNQLLLSTFKTLGFREVPLDQKQPGDVLVFQYARAASHAGIYLGESEFIHVPMTHPKKACVLKLQGDFQERLRKVFVFPGIT
jgi:hypothetical protein